MTLCSNECIPCCDFCIYAKHDFVDGVRSGPIGCNFYKDQKHQEIAEGCGSCETYHCSLALSESFGHSVSITKLSKNDYVIVNNWDNDIIQRFYNADEVFRWLSNHGIVNISSFEGRLDK